MACRRIVARSPEVHHVRAPFHTFGTSAALGTFSGEFARSYRHGWMVVYGAKFHFVHVNGGAALQDRVHGDQKASRRRFSAGLPVAILPEVTLIPGLRVIRQDEGLPALPGATILLIKAREPRQPETDALSAVIVDAFDTIRAIPPRRALKNLQV